MNVKPLADRVLVQPAEAEEKRLQELSSLIQPKKSL